jgi:hypothetical protein
VKRQARDRIIFAAAAMLVVPVIYVLRLNHAAGLMTDDAWYMVLAKSLADGTGYRLVSSAATPIQPLYPPGSPAILSLVFRISPEFPQNLWLLKSVSIAAMFGVGLLTYVYLHRHRRLSKELAFLLALAVTITPAFVFLATSTVMSECCFTLCQLAALVMIHRSVKTSDEAAGGKMALLAGVLAGTAMLTRSAAIALIVAAVLWLLKQRLWRRAALFGTVVVLCVLPWMVYARTNAPTAAERTAHGGAVAYEYVDQLSMRWAGAPIFGRIAARELPERIQTNVVDIFGRGIGGILAPTIFRTGSESGEEVVSLVPRVGMGANAPAMAISFVLSTIALIGYTRTVREQLTVAELLVPITLAIIVLWPFWSFRFVLPVTPFLLLYFTRGVQMLAPRAVRVVLLSLIGLNLYDHAGYIAQARTAGSIGWIEQARDVDALLDWINNGGLVDDGLLVTTNPGLVYMRTGRKSIASDHPLMEWGRWKRRGVRYVAVLYATQLPTGAETDFTVLYHAGHLWVIQI